MSALRISLIASLAGCATAPTSARYSARLLGCDASEIWITDEAVSDTERSWRAVCRNERFRCTLTYTRSADADYDVRQQVVCEHEVGATRGTGSLLDESEGENGPEVEAFFSIHEVHVLLHAVPLVRPEAIEVTIEFPSRLDGAACEVSFEVDGVSASFASRYAPLDYGGSWTVVLSHADALHMASAEQVAGRLCGSHAFSLAADHRTVLGEIVNRSRAASAIEVDE